MSDLVDATGLTKPSLYAAFGNKASMYRSSLDRYIDQQSVAAYAQLKRDDVDATEAIRRFLKASLATVTDARGPKGCLVLSSSADACGGHLEADEAKKVEQINTLARATYMKFFKRALVSVGRSADGAPALAAYLMTLHTGLRQMTTRGLTQAEMDDVVDISVASIAHHLKPESTH